MNVTDFSIVRTPNTLSVYYGKSLMSILNLKPNTNIKAFLKRLDRMYHLKPGSLATLLTK